MSERKWVIITVELGRSKETETSHLRHFSPQLLTLGANAQFFWHINILTRSGRSFQWAPWLRVKRLIQFLTTLLSYSRQFFYTETSWMTISISLLIMPLSSVHCTCSWLCWNSWHVSTKTGPLLMVTMCWSSRIGSLRAGQLFLIA